MRGKGHARFRRLQRGFDTDVLSGVSIYMWVCMSEARSFDILQHGVHVVVLSKYKY